MIEARGIFVDAGPVQILTDVSVKAEAGELVTVVGANGAGKTTLLRAISGLMPPREGEVLLAGERIDRTPAHLIARRGLVHVPQGRQIIPNLSVETNLRIGARNTKGLDAAEIERRLQAEYARFPILRDRAELPGGSLSGGEQQMLALSRGLMMRPRVLMLDEPSLGLAPRVVRDILGTLRSLADDGLAVILVEQLAHLALAIADTAYVLRGGNVVMSGKASDLAGKDVLDGYLC